MKMNTKKMQPLLLLKSRREGGASPRVSEKRPWGGGRGGQGEEASGSAVSVGLMEATAPGYCCLPRVYPIAYSGSLFLSLHSQSLQAAPCFSGLSPASSCSSPHPSSHLRDNWRSGQPLT